MMDNFKQECKLCDNIITDTNFEVIEGVAKDMFDNLLLKLTLTETQNVMCTMCSSKLIAALNFKTKCLDTDNTIIPYVDFKNPKPVDLKQIYAKEKGNKQGGISLDDRDVCRLCLQPMSGDHKSIQEVPVDSIKIYIPEINFEATTNPMICIKCHDTLHAHSTFIKTCLDVNKKINSDAINGQEIFLKDQYIKTEVVESKSEETDEDILFDINKEELNEGDTSLQCLTDLRHTEESKSLYELDHLKQTGAQSTFANIQSEKCSFKSTSESRSADHERRHKRVSEAQVNKIDHSKRNSKRRCLTIGLKVQEYQCDKCTYNTTRKNNFMQHSLIHKDPSELQVYECDECLYKSIRKDHLKQHQLRHKDPAEVKMFKCDKCTFETKRKGNLITHSLTHKDPAEMKVFRCDQCDFKSIQKGNLSKHQLGHKDPAEVESFKCDKCSFQTKRKHYLITHCLKHRDSSVFQCDECDYKSIRKSDLKKHQLQHKQPSEVPVFKCDECDCESFRKGDIKRDQLIYRGSSQVKMFKCDKCKFETKYKGNLNKNFEVTTNQDQEISLNNKSVKTEEIGIKSEETEEETLFETVYIKEEEPEEGDTSLQSVTDSTHTEGNKSLYELDHRKQTSGQSTFANNQSDECSLKITSESPSADHEWRQKRTSEAQENKSDPNSKSRCLTRDSKVQEFQCDKCTYNTKRKDHFKRHILIHKDPSEVQMYECDKCLYRSIQKVSLERHQLRHKDPAEVKMFKCDKCTFETKHKNNLVAHCLRHEDPSEVRMFKCDECDYLTIRKGDLISHRLIHKDPSEVKMYKCEKCKYITKRKPSLTKHSLSHRDPTEVRVFQCDECDYKSFHRYRLKSHQLRHKDPSEVRMFECNECDYKCLQKGSLNRHQLKHKGPAEVQMENGC